MRSTLDDSLTALVIHFTRRFVDPESPTEEWVHRNRLTQFLALIFVAAPMLMVLVVRGQERILVQIGTFDFEWWWAGLHYTLICYEMSVIGLIMALRWETLFPGREDYLILTPLPVSTRRLFLAKAIAVTTILLSFALAANAVLAIVIGVMQPRAFIAHAVAVLAASVFSVLSFLALQGILINVLPTRTFRRISPSLQMVAIALLVTLLLVLPLVGVSLRPLTTMNSPLLDYFPPVWFLGIYELLAPSSPPIPNVTEWAWNAVIMTVLMMVLVVVCYGAGYRRHSRRMLEDFDEIDQAPRWWERAGKNIRDSLLNTNAFQRAAFEFIGKIADRSSKHRVSIALYSGLGIALALSSLFVIDRREAFPIKLSARGVLEAPAVLSFLLVAGWRSTFGIPYELAANWIFQMTTRKGAADFRKAIRKWLFVCRVLPLYVVVACFEFSWFDPRMAISHLVVDLITTAFLVEALFFGFRKVPFTCAYLQSKLQLAFYAVLYLFAYTSYTSLVADLKGWASVDPRHLARFASLSLILFGVILIYRSLAGAERSRFVYEDRESGYQQLDLS